MVWGPAGGPGSFKAPLSMIEVQLSLRTTANTLLLYLYNIAKISFPPLAKHFLWIPFRVSLDSYLDAVLWARQFRAGIVAIVLLKEICNSWLVRKLTECRFRVQLDGYGEWDREGREGSRRAMGEGRRKEGGKEGRMEGGRKRGKSYT